MYTKTYHTCQVVQILMALLQNKGIEDVTRLCSVFYDVASDCKEQGEE